MKHPYTRHRHGRGRNRWEGGDRNGEPSGRRLPGPVPLVSTAGLLSVHAGGAAPDPRVRRAPRRPRGLPPSGHVEAGLSPDSSAPSAASSRRSAPGRARATSPAG